MKTVSEVTAWLNTPGHIKCLLADITEVGNSEVSDFFLSTMAYYSDNVSYTACITGGLSFTESLNTSGQASMGYGSLEIVNTAGINDVFLQYIWNKRPIKIYLGDPSWPKSDFILVFDGLIQELTAQNETSLSFSLFDKLQRLNESITEVTLQNTAYSENTKENILPLLFGECFNIQPLLVDNGSSASAGQVYMVHNGAIQDIIEVRDNGIPIPVDIDLTTGTFTLLNKPYGTITCSAQGDTPYTNTVAGIITKLVTEYGLASNKFTASEVGFTDVTNTSAVGIYINDRKNILEACNILANSINANLICPSVSVDSGIVSNSKLKLVEIKAPAGTPKYYLSDNNMLLNTLRIDQLFTVNPSIKLGYCKNHTVQATVSEGLNPTSTFDEEWLYAISTNSSNQANYRDSGAVVETPTQLLTTQQAQAEADKRLALWQQQRILITASYLPDLIFAQLGDIVQITSQRFGLSSGKLGMVYSVNRNWITGFIEIGVLV